MRYYGLIGYPLSHSFSRKYFLEKFIEQNIDASFSNYSIESLDSLRSLIEEDNISGFAITIPYKRSIIPLLHWNSEEVSKMNACNCVVVKDDKWLGYNTDVIGFEKSFVSLLKPAHSKALILGTGGAAAAVQFVLNKLNIPFINVSRTSLNDNLTYNQLNLAYMSDYKIIINCSPVGTYPDVNQAPDIPYQYITSEHYLFDLIYNPEETAFLKKGKEKNATIKNGYEMLVLQAEENWKIWNSL